MTEFIIYRDKKKQWRWKLVSSNGRTIADSGEGYVRKIDCLASMNIVRTSGNFGIRYD